VLLSRKVALGAGLLALSGALYLLQYAAFGNARSTLFYLLQDLAFLPISVLVLTLIVSGVLKQRERQILLHKLNMIIGAFYSEVGNGLIRALTVFDPDVGALRACLALEQQAGAPRGSEARDRLGSCAPVDARAGDLVALRDLLAAKRAFLLVLLENPNLLEHETFSELIWAVLHLTEELTARNDPAHLAEPDLDHISGDMQRAYQLLAHEWVGYMEHLRSEYPYLYSLATRLDPFDPQASAAIS
jgi:hypothetical protein